MWQSCVEIECYSIGYFNRVTAFKLLYLSYVMCSYNDSCYIYIAHLRPAVNGSSEIQRFERSDMIKICDEKNIQFLHGTVT